MRRRIVIMATVMAAGMTLCRGEEWKKDFTVGAAPELRVDARDGNVTIHVWARSTIGAVVSTSGHIGPGAIEVSDHQLGDRVELKLRMPREIVFGTSRRAIKVDLQVPRNTRLNIHTGDGAIRVYDVAGEMRLVSGDGGIDAEDVSGNVEAITGDGHLHVKGKLDVVNLRTGDGSVEVSVLPGSQMKSSWKIQTGDGSVTVRLPSSLGADLDAHTGDGSVRVDLPLVGPGKQGHSVTGKLSGGGPLLTIRTGDGSVTLSRI